MKKYLLGALLVLGTMAYAQDNQKIIKVDTNGNAKASLPIEVNGQVFDKAELSLVVEITSALSPTGTGFSFQMPDIFSETAAEVSAEGAFNTYLKKGEDRVAFADKTDATKSSLNIAIERGAAADAITGITPGGTAQNVTLDYVLIGGTGNDAAGKTNHTGAVKVIAKAANNVTVGSYSDTLARLIVEVKDQKTN